MIIFLFTNLYIFLFPVSVHFVDVNNFEIAVFQNFANNEINLCAGPRSIFVSAFCTWRYYE